MSLVPYALRPRYVVRSFVLRRGVAHRNPLSDRSPCSWSARATSCESGRIRQGLILGNPYWRAVGGVLVVREISKRVLQKTPERLGRERLRAGHVVTIAVTAPRLDLSRRARRAELKRLETEALASVSASKRRS